MIKTKPRHTGTHLSLDDRIYIEAAIERHLTFKEMSVFLEKDPTTISKEIRRHRTEKNRDVKLTAKYCGFSDSCTKSGLCGSSFCRPGSKCSKCKISNCIMYCEDYVPAVCPLLKKPPYVCNGCNRVKVCGYDKMYYRAKYADDMYHELLRTSRRGINQTPESLARIDALVTPLILRGQSLAHIYSFHRDEIPCSKRTLYNYMERNVLTAKNIDLPRKVRYKRRKSVKDTTDEIIPNYKQNRTYNDFQKYIGEYTFLSPVQMDTVEGRKGGKVFLTLFFCNCSIMLIFLLEHPTQLEVKRVFDYLENTLGTKLFKKLFPVILTDNGSEFKNPTILEKNADGKERTKIFYCEPNQSWQKGQIEKNHEFIRYILPKGKSFDELTDEQVKAITNHINSLAREGLNGATPYSVGSILLDKSIFKELGLHQIPHDEVLLKPELLKR